MVWQSVGGASIRPSNLDEYDSGSLSGTSNSFGGSYSLDVNTPSGNYCLEVSFDIQDYDGKSGARVGFEFDNGNSAQTWNKPSWVVSGTIYSIDGKLYMYFNTGKNAVFDTLVGNLESDITKLAASVGLVNYNVSYTSYKLDI